MSIVPGSTATTATVDWQRFWPLLLVAIGLVLAAVLALGSWKFFIAGCGAVVLGTLVILRPQLGFYLTVMSVPLEAVGRLGSLFKGVDLTIAKIMAMLTIAAWILQLALRRTRLIWPTEATTLTLMLLAGVVSLIGAEELATGGKGLVRFLSTILFFLLVVNMVRTRQEFHRTMTMLLVVSVATFAFAIVQRYLPSFVFEERSGWNRAGGLRFGVEQHALDAGRFGTVARSSGASYHAIVMALNTCFMMPLLLSYLGIVRAHWLRVACLLAVVVAFGAALSAFSRTGLILLILLVPLMYFKGVIRFNPWHLIAGLVGGVLLFVFAPESLLERVFNLDSYTVQGSESLRHRLDLLVAGWNAFTSNPFNGLGLENTWGIFDYYDYPDTGTIITVHNGYLQWALELGIPGAALLFLFLWQLLRRNIQAPRLFHVQGDADMALLCRALFISLVAFMLAGLTVDFLRIGFKNMWILMGLMVAAHRIAMTTVDTARSADPTADTTGVSLRSGT